MGLDVPFRVIDRARLAAAAAVVLSLMAVALAGDAAAASPDTAQVSVSGVTGTASQGSDPCHVRPRPPGCPTQGGSGSECDDPEYVENFYEGDRAACLESAGCSLCDPDAGSGGGGSGATKPELLSVPKSLRLSKLLKRGIRFRVALVRSDSAVTSSLAMKGSKVGTLKKSGLAAGNRSLTLKLSRKGKAKLRRALKRKQKVKAALKVSVSAAGSSRSGFTKTIVVKR